MIPPTSLTPTTPLGPAAEQQDKLRHAAQQFESMLLAQWWQQMRHSGFGGDSSQDPIYSAVDAAGMEAVTLAMSRAGGIGVATMIVKELQPDLDRGPKGASGSQRADGKAVAAATTALKSAAARPIGTLRAETTP
ncbi:MAG: hypothetical protein ACRD2E_08515 [Terriglobales bacterium]